MNLSPANSKTLQARIVSGSLVLLSGSSLTTAINLAYNVVIARFLGPSGFGQTTAVFTLLTLVSAVTLSYQLMSAKAIARGGSAGSGTADARNFARSAWAAGLLIALCLIVFRNGIARYLNLPGSFLIVLLAVGALFYVPLGSRRGVVQGAYGFSRLARNLVVEGIVRLAGSLLAVSLGFGVEGVIAANAAAVIAAYFAIVPPRIVVGATLPFSLVHREVAQAMVFFSGQLLINNCDIVLVKHFFLPAEAGLYAVIAMVGRVIFALCQAVVNSMVPIVAGTREGERKNLTLVATSLGLVLAIGSVLALGLGLTPAWVWTRLFGTGFALPGPHGFPFLLALYAVSTVVYCLSAVTITYEMSYKIANTSWVQLLFSVLMIAGISLFHSSLEQVILVQIVLVSVMLLVVAVPFLRVAAKGAESPGTVVDTLRLVRSVSEDEVIGEFLKSDFSKGSYRHYHVQLHALVYSPNFESQDENAKRRALLSVQHLALWKELPSGTQWFEVELQESDLARVRVFPRAQWRRFARGDFGITRVAGRMRSAPGGANDQFMAKIQSIRESLLGGGVEFGSVVMIGLNLTEPLTVIDGNHRFVAAVLEGEMQKLRFFCGLSPEMTRCCWYKTNLRTLSRYARNLARHLHRDPEAELAGLFEMTGQKVDREPA